MLRSFFKTANFFFGAGCYLYFTSATSIFIAAMALITIRSGKATGAVNAALRLCLCAMLAAVVVFCCFYIFSSRGSLASWYFGMNGCFYRAPYWKQDFFTPGIKSDGNTYCIIAVALSLAWLACLFRGWRNKVTRPARTITVSVQGVLFTVGIISVATGLWWWGNKQSLPSYDEAFSAVNAAGIPSFQCVSYYMLPNNHLFFNMVNGFLFRSVYDKVFTGRLISLAAYWGVCIVLFWWLRRVFGRRWLAFIATIAIAMQFETWGFAFQARGYELYLLCEWGALIALLQYLASGHKRWLIPFAACCIAGYCCLPSFLYFHASYMVLVGLYQLFYRKKEVAFWACQAVVITGVFLFYLPAFCFSGVEAITSNRYVAPMAAYKTQSYGAFYDWMQTAIIPDLLKHIFSDIQCGSVSLNLPLLCLPLLLLLNVKNKTRFLYGLFYLIMWLMLLAFTVHMKRVPFERNLTGHFSVAMAGIMITIHWLAGLLKMRGQRPLQYLLLPAVAIYLCVHFKSANKVMLKDNLYGYDVNDTYAGLYNNLDFIPRGSSVGFSEESFYICYMCGLRGCSLKKCPSGREQFYIMQNDEPVPPFLSNYRLVKRITFYNVYQLLPVD